MSITTSKSIPTWGEVCNLLKIGDAILSNITTTVTNIRFESGVDYDIFTHESNMPIKYCKADICSTSASNETFSTSHILKYEYDYCSVDILIITQKEKFYKICCRFESQYRLVFISRSTTAYTISSVLFNLADYC